MKSRNIWFTSDSHFSHFNIIGLCKRPFQTAEEMNERLIKNWNERVNPEDEVYHLGDVAFYRSTNGNGLKIHPREIISRLNGKITYICGNHDAGGHNGLHIKNHRIVINISKLFVNLVHNPEHASLEYELNIHGHLHGKERIVKVIERAGKKSLFIDVGVECWQYRPVAWQKIYEIYSQWKAGHNVEEIYRK